MNSPITAPRPAAPRPDASSLLPSIRRTAQSTLSNSAGSLLDAAAKLLEARLESFDTENHRDYANLFRELSILRPQLEQSLPRAVQFALEQALIIGSNDAGDSLEIDLQLLGEDEVEKQLEKTRTSHHIAQVLEWELADLNTRISFLSRVEGVNANLNPISPDILASLLHDWVAKSELSTPLKPHLIRLLRPEFSALAVALYHELNAWLIREGIMPKIDLRSMVQRTATTERYQQLTHQSLQEIANSNPAAQQQASASGQPHAQSAGAGSQAQRSSQLPQLQSVYDMGLPSRGYHSTRLLSIHPPASASSPASEIEALSRYGIELQQRGTGLWSRLKNKLGERFGASMDGSDAGDSRRTAFGNNDVHSRLQQTVTQFDVTIMQLLDHVETQLQSNLPGNLDSQSLNAKAVASLPRLVQFREEMQAAASSANERATIELVALMFDHILTDESIPSLARILFARLQIPVLRVAIRENEAFMESTHPARDFIDRVGSALAGYAGEAKIDERLQAEVRRLVLAAEKSPNVTGQFFSRLLYDFELFLERYGRELREVSVLGVPMLEQTEDFKVNAVLYTIELRKLTDDVPCDKRVRDFLLHSWVSVMSAISHRFGKDSQQVASGLRIAADLVWCGVPKATMAERTELVSELPELIRRVEASLGDAGAPAEAQKKASTRLRGSLLQIIRSPAHQAPDIVFDTLLSKLQQFEQTVIEAGEKSPNYRIPLATLRTQIASRALSLQVIEPTDLKLDAASVATATARQWADSLRLGNWFRVEIQAGRPQILQLAWLSPHRNYMLFAEPQGTSGVITEPNTVALLVERGMFKPVERETITERATKDLLNKVEK